MCVVAENNRGLIYGCARPAAEEMWRLGSINSAPAEGVGQNSSLWAVNDEGKAGVYVPVEVQASNKVG